MKITVDGQTVESTGLGQTSTFGIKNSAAAFQLLSSGLYTNKIRAVLREIGCNGVDAHALNGKQSTPIDVKLPNRLDGQFFIRDYGPGLSHDQVMRLYSTYFDSTKQASDDFIGGFGVGSKSPFAYTDSFTVVSRHKGMEQTYVAFVNDDGMPTISTLTEAVPTTEEDGLSVGFPVRPEDLYSFENEAKEVYSAFKVPPRILGNSMEMENFSSTPVVPGVGLLKSESYRYGRSIELNMGGVRYPLNAFKEKLSNTNVELTAAAKWLYGQPVELDVPIGVVSVAASREALQYDKKTIAAIPDLLHDGAMKVIQKLKTLLDATPSDKSPVERAQLLTEELEKPGNNLAWSQLGAKLLVKLFPSVQDRMICEMALNGSYTVDPTAFPRINLWQMNSNVHNRLHELSVRGHKIDSFEGRKKALTNLRRSWNAAAVNNDSYLSNLFTYSSHGIAPKVHGGANPYSSPKDMAKPTFRLGKHLTAVESTVPLNLESLLANHVHQPAHDYYSQQNKDYVISPVPQFDPNGKQRPLTDDEMQEFQTQKKEFCELYSITTAPLAPLPVVVAPVKTKVTATVWSIPLETVRDPAAMKRTLRGLPSSGVAIQNNTVSTDPIAYIVYDRKESQATLQKGGETDLFKQARKHNKMLDHRKMLSEYNVPTNVQLVDKKDLPDFKKIHPAAMSFDKCLNNLRGDPVFLATVQKWSNSRPHVVELDSRSREWASLAKQIEGLQNDSLLSTIVKGWSNYDDSYQVLETDREYCSFYNYLLGTSYSHLESSSTKNDIQALNAVYPFVQYFNYNTPLELKIRYILDSDSKRSLEATTPSISLGMD